jgi:uncharacterized CHY-type Zn-finger protein
MRYDYPPEYDWPLQCGVCLRPVDAPEGECECPECPECGEAGNPECYRNGHMEDTR